MDSIVNQIEKRIASWKRGKIFFPTDFSDVASYDAIRKTLERLCKSEKIIRLARGIFLYPAIDTQWGLGVIYPPIEEIAKRVAKHEKCRIVPTGAYALNVLGLSTQVPTNAVFFTDGAPRNIKVGIGRGITFKHTSEVKRLAFRSEMMMLISSAMREIGEGKITDEQKQIISVHLQNVSADDFKYDINLMPEWVRKTLQEL